MLDSVLDIFDLADEDDSARFRPSSWSGVDGTLGGGGCGGIGFPLLSLLPIVLRSY